MSYFTQQHFDLLNKFQGQKKDRENPEHITAYKELVSAYKIVDEWAQKLKQDKFPDGKSRVIAKPTNQGQRFDGYLWGKVYPSKSSPRELAYTIGLNTDGIDIKIDTVNLGDKDPVRLKYLETRGKFGESGIVSLLSIEDCLKMDMVKLVSWSNKQIKLFTMSYDEVANKIGLKKPQKTLVAKDYIQSEQSAKFGQLHNITPLNQILYGPPGTGKTFNSIEKAVKAAEPSFLTEAKNKTDCRNDYKDKYDELVAVGRIRFVTFHQSYGYEEFVEGLSAKTEGEQLSYFEKDGVFKRICEDASQGVAHDEDPVEIAILKFKSELEESTRLELETITGKSFSVEYHGNTTFRVFPKGTIHDDLGNGYPVSIENIKKVYRGIGEKNIYNPSYVKSILSYIKEKYNLPEFEEIKPATPPNFVLIIDEINRGNISKVFGELITLIEPSKRLGQPEALEVILPYSGEKFSVPDNLYIIGTMNTADRSLALMDTALRRRFDFVEMMPEYGVLHDEEGQAYCIEKDGYAVDLARLLKTLNSRISALYDREHTLGHAFLMPVVTKIKTSDQSAALSELANCFKNKIIPLLAEYFFEDWQKIRLVLGDNQKEKMDIPSVIEKVSVEFENLFGDTDELDLLDDETHEYRLISANSDLWDDPLTYIGMYDVTVLGD